MLPIRFNEIKPSHQLESNIKYLGKDVAHSERFDKDEIDRFILVISMFTAILVGCGLSLATPPIPFNFIKLAISALSNICMITIYLMFYQIVKLVLISASVRVI